MRSLSRLALVLVAVAAVWLYAASGRFYRSTEASRARSARASEGGIEVAIVWPGATNQPPPTFVLGAELAVERFNTRGGVRVAGSDGQLRQRQIELVTYDEPEEPNLTGARVEAFRSRRMSLWDVRSRIASQTNIVAVVGFRSSAGALEASVTFEKNGAVYLVSSATSPGLTGHGFRYVVRTVPTDRDFAHRLTSELLARRLQRVAVIGARSRYGRTLVHAIDEKLGHLSLECPGAPSLSVGLVHQERYATDSTDFRLAISAIAAARPDAIIVADEAPRGIEVMRQIRELGLAVPLFASEALDDIRMCKVEPPLSEAYVATAFSLEELRTHPAAAAVIDEYVSRHGEPPDRFAAQGYEAILFLVEAMRRGRTAVPLGVATSFQTSGEFEGLEGKVRFDGMGQIQGKRLFIKECARAAFQLSEVPLGDGCRVVELGQESKEVAAAWRN